MCFIKTVVSKFSNQVKDILGFLLAKPLLADFIKKFWRCSSMVAGERELIALRKRSASPGLKPQ
jgi:uncharacterized membrane protein